MKRREFLSIVVGAATWPTIAHSQQAPRVSRIGWLTAQRQASLAPFIEAFRGSLTDLGRIEGKNLSIEFRYGDDDIGRVPELAAQLVRHPVELIVAQGLAVPVLSTLNLAIPIVYGHLDQYHFSL